MASISTIFKFIIFGLLYVIIFIALRIMYKDIKNGGARKVTVEKTIGLEILRTGDNEEIKKGAIVPVRRGISIGRKNDNNLILNDSYVSGHHAKIYLKNGEYYLEDMASTNGTLLNNLALKGKTTLRIGDEIKIGSSLFRVID